MGRAKKVTIICQSCGEPYEGESPARKYCPTCKINISKMNAKCRRENGISLAEKMWLEKAGKPLNDVFEELKITGEDYATRQKRLTLASLPKIEVNL